MAIGLAPKTFVCADVGGVCMDDPKIEPVVGDAFAPNEFAENKLLLAENQTRNNSSKTFLSFQIIFPDNI